MTEKLKFENGQITIPNQLREEYNLEGDFEVVLEKITSGNTADAAKFLLYFLPRKTDDEAKHENRVKKGMDTLRSLAGLGGDDITDASTTIDDVLYGDQSPFANQ